jgi:predicted RNA-binding Zn-ribbon protein involved in translation (DUF1610 family)
MSDPETIAPEEITVLAYCDTCGEEERMPLIEETELTEVYACPECGGEKEYTVR